MKTLLVLALLLFAGNALALTTITYPQNFGDKGSRIIEFSEAVDFYGYTSSTQTVPEPVPYAQGGGGCAGFPSHMDVLQTIVVPNPYALTITRSGAWGLRPEWDLAIKVDGTWHTMNAWDSVTVGAGLHVLEYYSVSGGSFALFATHSSSGMP